MVNTNFIHIFSSPENEKRAYCTYTLKSYPLKNLSLITIIF
ncbi:MAG: hypothetical protein UX66_C0014G0007 [Parcubacteria group bacterium GW2011_GWF2_46_8]|nr:MAG: hypothetical protein UX14_C0011G0006 [Parcubacteria group bacterium GW2011_GWF1_45_5]KKU47421.1 MAG: hypothetical protein UX66_C0014G0007 [Parcubacteria group bacterium GW2011_GWF2_46_8]